MALLAAVVALCHGEAAHARPDLVYPDRSYVEIGAYDRHLSQLCAMRLFNQRTQYAHSAYFERNRVLLGAAAGDGWNLEDPTGARRLDLDYWFRNDGFSDCEVYKSVNPDRQRRKPPG